MSMKYYDWSETKNQKIKQEREISFEEVVLALESKQILAIVKHPNTNRYPQQQIFIVNINHYAYLVPFVEDEEKVFLKTIIPSRKATKKYIIEKEKL